MNSKKSALGPSRYTAKPYLDLQLSDYWQSVALDKIVKVIQKPFFDTKSVRPYIFKNNTHLLCLSDVAEISGRL